MRRNGCRQKPRDALDDLGVQAARRLGALRLQPSPDQQQARQREQVGDGVDCKGHHPPDPEQGAADRRPGEQRHVLARLVLRDRIGKLGRRHHLTERRALRDGEEREACPLDCRDGEDVRERQLVEGVCDRDARQGDAPRRVRDEHEALPVHSVGDGARHEQARDERERADERRQPGLGRRVGEGEDEQRESDA